MSKGFGKVQLRILDELKCECEGEGFLYSIWWLKEAIGVSQQSANRAMKGLVDNDLVVKVKVIGSSFAVNSWRYEYMLKENVGNQEEYIRLKGEKLISDDLKARELGYDNYQDQLMATMFR